MDFPSRFRSSNGCFPWRRYAFNFTRIRGKFPLLSLIEGRRKNFRDHRRLIRSSEPFFNRIPEGLPVRRDRSQPSKFYGDFGGKKRLVQPPLFPVCAETEARIRGSGISCRTVMDRHGRFFVQHRGNIRHSVFPIRNVRHFFFVTGNVLHFLHNVQTTITFVRHIG